jgi:hypothetical protein
VDTTQALRAKQVRVAIAMAAGAAATALPFFWRPLPAVTREGAPAMWAAAALVVGALLLFAIGRLANHRFFSAEDIDGGGLAANSAKAALLQAQLQNTLEQALLALLAWGGWLAFGPEPLRGLVPVFAGYFALGRLLFMLGYRRGAAARALGFTLTFYPSVVLIALALPRALAVLVGGG